MFDESVDLPVVHHLRAAGYDVQSILETTPGIPDEAVLAMARASDAVLVTIDKDFGELVYRQRLVSCGVVLLRLEELPTAQKAVILESVLQTHQSELASAFTVVTAQQVRVRKLSSFG